MWLMGPCQPLEPMMLLWLLTVLQCSVGGRDQCSLVYSDVTKMQTDFITAFPKLIRYLELFPNTKKSLQANRNIRNAVLYKKLLRISRR